MSGKGQLRATLIVNQDGKVIGFTIPADITESGVAAHFSLASPNIQAREVELVRRYKKEATA